MTLRGAFSAKVLGLCIKEVIHCRIHHGGLTVFQAKKKKTLNSHNLLSDCRRNVCIQKEFVIALYCYVGNVTMKWRKQAHRAAANKLTFIFRLIKLNKINQYAICKWINFDKTTFTKRLTTHI